MLVRHHQIALLEQQYETQTCVREWISILISLADAIDEFNGRSTGFIHEFNQEDFESARRLLNLLSIDIQLTDLQGNPIDSVDDAQTETCFPEHVFSHLKRAIAIIEKLRDGFGFQAIREALKEKQSPFSSHPQWPAVLPAEQKLRFNVVSEEDSEIGEAGFVASLNGETTSEFDVSMQAFDGVAAFNGVSELDYFAILEAVASMITFAKESSLLEPPSGFLLGMNTPVNLIPGGDVFVPSPLQSEILKELNGKVMRVRKLADRVCGGHHSRLYRNNGIKELEAMGRVRKCASGWYRPDAPPSDAVTQK